MTTTRSVALLILVATVGLTVAPVASGAVVGVFADDADSEESTTNATVSTFMQSSAADAENTVESEMFEARYDAADNDSRDDIVRERTDDLETQLADLEAERETLRNQSDELHPGEYQARMTQLTVEIRSLERSIDRTEKRAVDAGVDEERLATLRTNAAALDGPDVAEIARGLGGGPPDDRGNQAGGPPDDRGNQAGGQPDDQGNQTGSPPDDRGNQADNPSDDRGNQ